MCNERFTGVSVKCARSSRPVSVGVDASWPRWRSRSAPADTAIRRRPAAMDRHENAHTTKCRPLKTGQPAEWISCYVRGAPRLCPRPVAY